MDLSKKSKVKIVVFVFVWLFFAVAPSTKPIFPCLIQFWACDLFLKFLSARLENSLMQLISAGS